MTNRIIAEFEVFEEEGRHYICLREDTGIIRTRTEVTLGDPTGLCISTKGRIVEIKAYKDLLDKEPEWQKLFK